MNLLMRKIDFFFRKNFTGFKVRITFSKIIKHTFECKHLNDLQII